MRRETMFALAVALLFALLFWFADACYVYFQFADEFRGMLLHEPETLADAIWRDVPPDKLFDRLFVLGACLISGGLVAAFLARYRDRDAALQHREAQFRGIVENAHELILTCDPGGDLTFVSPAARDLLGRDPEALLGGCLDDLLHDEDRLARDGQRHDGLELRLCHADGSWRCFRGSIAPVHDAHGHVLYYVAALQDITEQLRLADQVRQSEKMEALGQLAGGIAHDFNNQLAGILGYADILAHEAPDPRLAGYAQAISRAAHAVADANRQLLAFARKEDIEPTPTDVHQVVRDVVSLLEHGMTRQVLIREDLRATHTVVLADAGRLQNALLNLAINARDAMPNGGDLRLTTDNIDLQGAACQLDQGRVAPGRYLRLTVSDTGSGIPPDVLPHIFEPFFTTKAAGKGTGIGLAAVYGTVQSLAGGITVRTAVGKGTSFTIYLPRHEGRPATETIPRDQVQDLGGCRVLVVDDDPDVRDIAADMLAGLGCRPATVATGRDAVHTYGADTDPFDVVLLDLALPDMDGRATFARLQQVDPGLRCIICSAYTGPGEAEQLLKEGALGVLGKPFTRQELGAAIASAIGR